MNFDERFDLDEFREHFQSLGLLDYEDLDALIRRTTQDTRNGEAFSFKPNHMWIGSSSATRFYSGFDCDLEHNGLNPQKKDAEKPSDRNLSSSFWFRFDCGRYDFQFQFRVFCSGQSIAALRPYECLLPFRDVVPGGVELRAEKDGQRVHSYLTINSRRPPRALIRLVPMIPSRDPIYDRIATEADFFRPQGCEDMNEAEAGVICPLGYEQAIVKTGLWLTHRFSFYTTIRQYKLLWQCMIRLRLIKLEPDLRASRYVPYPQSIYSLEPADFPSFHVRYLVEGLVSNGIVQEAELGLLEKELKRHDSRSWSLILEGLFKMRRWNSIEQTIKDVAGRMGPTRPIPPHCMRVRRCLVTPTRCIPLSPRLETSNSLLRAFEDYLDRFLRVQFEDEDESLQITSEILEVDAAMDTKKGIFARLRRALSFGLYVAGRQYVFLCFGESQVKERGCWMISETENFTVQKVLRWIGDLGQEKNIAKHAARQGLVLSTSRPIDLNELQVRVEYDFPDITITDSGHTYTFTDGAGQCRQELVNHCANTFGYDYKRVNPSAVQVRIGGGSKGVLCVVPDDMIEENLVRVRKSMVKFKSTSRTTLNVLKVSTYGIAYLNRQAVLLLEEQGVQFHVLLQLFLEEKARIEGLEQHVRDNNLAALTTFPLARAIASGFTEDPLVQNIIRVLKCRLLGDLKWKARIPIEKGTYLMGVADETRTLMEGEIFCQIESPIGHKVVTGTCTIFRNPCLHPGDLRLVQAVDNPSLSYLKNVIVFSTYGVRDLPSMMGGGDLDGDFYTLLWDERLIIPREHEPMDYTPPRPEKVPWSITVDDTKEFFLKYIQNDILGLVCNAHLALADQSSPCDENCLRLAMLASNAVDFSKTGVPVNRTSYIPPGSYPDFMGKNQMPKTYQKKTPVRTYESQKVLGHMFRSIDPDPVFEPVEDFEWEPPFTDRVPECWETYLAKAAELKTHYDFELSGVLRMYAISEAECVAGVLLRSRGRRIRVDRDYSLRETVKDAYEEVALFFKSQAASYLQSHPMTGEEGEDRRAWAYACYKITYDESFSKYLDEYFAQSAASQMDGGSDPDEDGEADSPEGSEEVVPDRYLSFPWLFHGDVLGLRDGEDVEYLPEIGSAANASK